MYSLVGYELVNFTNQATGELVDGARLHLVAKKGSSAISNGLDVCSPFFTRSKIQGNLSLGSRVELLFALRNGKAICSGAKIL